MKLNPFGRNSRSSIRYALTAFTDLRGGRTARHAAFAALAAASGIVSLFLLLLGLLAATRGLLYGLVDSGPYDTSWGGPTLLGAWAVHLLGILVLPVALWALQSIALLLRNLRAHLIDGTPRYWTVPVALLLAALGALLFRSWLHQAV